MSWSPRRLTKAAEIVHLRLLGSVDCGKQSERSDVDLTADFDIEKRVGISDAMAADARCKFRTPGDCIARSSLDCGQLTSRNRESAA
jgi:predicted nucleotidyltransferase